MKYLKIPTYIFPIVIFILVILFDVILLNLPLTNILGYEYSAINGILLSLFGGILFIHKFKKSENNKPTYFSVISANYVLFSILILIPFILALLNTIIFGICPFSSGAFYYLVLTLPSYFVGTVLGYIIIKLTSKFVYLLFAIVFIIILLLPIIEIFLNPQVYFYTALLGYFPGNIYDEDLVVDSTLITYRLLNIFYFLTIILFSQKIDLKKYSGKIIFVSSIIIVGSLFVLVKPSIGYSTTHTTIKKELTQEIQTENFDIIYSSELSNREVKNLVIHHEYYFYILKSELNVQPKERIVSYIFKDNRQKRRLFGAGNADVAKPWLYNIYTTYENYDQSLKHELAHVFAAEFGVTPFKVASMINPSMIEGFAMMAEDDYNGNDIHYMAALAYNSGYTFPLTNLFDGLKFFSQSSSSSYIYSGSFVKYLKDEYGIEKIKELYGDLNFDKHYGFGLAQLEKNYYNFLNSLSFDINENEATLYFGRKPIFKRTCARYVAVQLRNGWNQYNSGDYKESEKTFYEIFQYSESYSALVGYVNSLIKTEQLEPALNLLSAEIEKYANTSYYFNLELILADLLIRSKKPEAATKRYLEMREHIPNVRYFLNVHNRLSILNKSVKMLENYLKGSSFDRYNILIEVFNETNKPDYIPALVTYSERLDQNYTDFIEKVEFVQFGNDEVSSYAAFKLAQLAVENLDYISAEKYIDIAVNSSSKNNFAVYSQYLNKIEWMIENEDTLEISSVNTHLWKN